MTKQVESIEVHSARRGLSLHKWVDDKASVNSGAALTDATLYYNIPVGKQVLITSLHCDLQTVSDDAAFYLVKCAAVAGGGAAVQLHGEVHLVTPAALTGGHHHNLEFNPPIRVQYSATAAKSLSVYVNSNDAGATVNVLWSGWVEDIT